MWDARRSSVFENISGPKHQLTESHTSTSSKIEQLLTTPKDKYEKSLILESEDSLTASALLRMVRARCFIFPFNKKL